MFWLTRNTSGEVRGFVCAQPRCVGAAALSPQRRLLGGYSSAPSGRWQRGHRGRPIRFRVAPVLGDGCERPHAGSALSCRRPRPVRPRRRWACGALLVGGCRSAGSGRSTIAPRGLLHWSADRPSLGPEGTRPGPDAPRCLVVVFFVLRRFERDLLGQRPRPFTSEELRDVQLHLQRVAAREQALTAAVQRDLDDL